MDEREVFVCVVFRRSASALIAQILKHVCLEWKFFFNHKLILGRGVKACPLCEWDASKLHEPLGNLGFVLLAKGIEGWKKQSPTPDFMEEWNVWNQSLLKVAAKDDKPDGDNRTLPMDDKFCLKKKLKWREEAWNSWRRERAEVKATKTNKINTENWRNLTRHHWCLRTKLKAERECRLCEKTNPGQKHEHQRCWTEKSKLSVFTSSNGQKRCQSQACNYSWRQMEKWKCQCC